MPILETTHSAGRGERFVVGVLWNWLGVGAGLFTGLLLSPYLIRKLGPEAYGLWALSFAMVEYCVFLDLGFRSATVKYVAHYWATDEPVRINEVINTVLVYSGVISSLLFGAIFAGSAYLDRFFQISASYTHSFRILVILISLSWCLGFVFNNFAASLEAVQRYDLSTKPAIITTILRASGTAVLLYQGYGLVEIGILVVLSQTVGYALYFCAFRRIFPELRISTRYAGLGTLRKMASFGIHTFVANISNLILNQSCPLLIGHFRPAAFVGYYTLPMRLLLYTGDAVGRAGVITNANAAELQARGDTKVLPELAVYTNRYCVTLFMPLAILFWTYGDRILQLWVPSMAPYSAPLLPVLLSGYMLGVIGQHSSGMLLQGLGRHQLYARGLAVEAILSLGALVLVIPRYGILGAAWVTCISMILNRGLFAPWLVSLEMGFSFLPFLRSIYAWPFACAVPPMALAFALRMSALPGGSWRQIAVLIVLIASSYYGLALFLCLPREHRLLLQAWLGRRLLYRNSAPA